MEGRRKRAEKPLERKRKGCKAGRPFVSGREMGGEGGDPQHGSLA